MVAINFTMFTDKVASREKRMTIRKKARAKSGDKIQLYTGMRTKGCRKLVEDDATCQGAFPVTISEHGVAIDAGLARRIGITWPIGGRDLDNKVAEFDGFSKWEDFRDFFRKHYGLPFIGYAHVWDWPADLAPSPQGEKPQ